MNPFSIKSIRPNSQFSSVQFNQFRRLSAFPSSSASASSLLLCFFFFGSFFFFFARSSSRSAVLSPSFGVVLVHSRTVVCSLSLVDVLPSASFIHSFVHSIAVVSFRFVRRLSSVICYSLFVASVVSVTEPNRTDRLIDRFDRYRCDAYGEYDLMSCQYVVRRI